MRFVDTNVLLYGVSPLPEDAGKRRRALELLREPDLAVSVQVFQEFYHQATRSTLGCDAVYSEDLSSEQDYGGLRVINPFADQANPR